MLTTVALRYVYECVGCVLLYIFVRVATGVWAELFLIVSTVVSFVTAMFVFLCTVRCFGTLARDSCNSCQLCGYNSFLYEASF